MSSAGAPTFASRRPSTASRCSPRCPGGFRPRSDCGGGRARRVRAHVRRVQRAWRAPHRHRACRTPGAIEQVILRSGASKWARRSAEGAREPAAAVGNADDAAAAVEQELWRKTFGGAILAGPTSEFVQHRTSSTEDSGSRMARPQGGGRRLRHRAPEGACPVTLQRPLARRSTALPTTSDWGVRTSLPIPLWGIGIGP